MPQLIIATVIVFLLAKLVSVICKLIPPEVKDGFSNE